MHFNTNYYVAGDPTFTPEYIAFRDRVIGENGTIASAEEAQKALDFTAAHPELGLTRYYDTRFGVRPRAGTGGGGLVYQRWYSVLGGYTEGAGYGNAQLVPDSSFGGVVWGGGSFDGGVTPYLSAESDYTWAIRYRQETQNTTGYFWGNRYDQVDDGVSGTGVQQGWTYLFSEFWRNYFNGQDRVIPTALPVGTVAWIFAVKQGPTVTLYDQFNNSLGSIGDVPAFAAQRLGIAGGTLPDGQSQADFHYERFLTATTALTSAQRAAIINL